MNFSSDTYRAYNVIFSQSNTKYIHLHHRFHVIRLWPELSLVAENSNNELIGYTLGKAEEILPLYPSLPPTASRGQGNAGFLQNARPKKSNPKYCGQNTSILLHLLCVLESLLTLSLPGHVTSLAVYKEYRQLGVARELMTRLHEEMTQFYGIDTVSLHCRVRNTAAIKVNSFDLFFFIKVTLHSATDKKSFFLFVI